MLNSDEKKNTRFLFRELLNANTLRRGLMHFELDYFYAGPLVHEIEKNPTKFNAKRLFFLH
jgi:hypothetical protein